MPAAKLGVMFRTGKGRGHIHELRKQGKIPAVVYGKGLAGGQPVELNSRELEDILGRQGRNALIDIVLSGKKNQNKHVVMVKDLQRDPIGGKIIHVDLCKISLRDKVQTAVSVNLTGESEGVKQGGILQPGLRELEIECLPANIPDYIVLDISGLDIGHHLTVADLPEQPGYKILSEPGAVLVTVVAPRMTEQPETTDGAEPVETFAVKPEVPRKEAAEMPENNKGE